MMKHIAFAGAVTVALSSLAQASTVTGDFGGTIGAPTGATNIIRFEGADTNRLDWGAQSSGGVVVPEDSSSLTINENPFSFDATGGGEFLLGTITWNNQSNFSTGGDWSSTVSLSLSFLNPTAIDLNESFEFSISNTPDGQPTAEQAELLGTFPDEISGFVLGASAFDAPVDLGGDLILDSVYFSLFDAGAASAYNSENGFWTNREGGTSTIAVYGSISEVPLPAGAWLLISGLGGLIVMRRREKQAA